MFSRTWQIHTDRGVGRPAFIAEFGVWDDRQLAAAEQVEAALAEIDLVRLAFCDPHGLARSKTLTAAAFRAVLRNGMDFSPGPFLFDTGHAVAVEFLTPDSDVGVSELHGAGGFVVVPDPSTFQLLPSTEPRTAWVLGDEFLRDGSRHPLSTRDVLRRVCDRYAALSLAPVIGLEVEWYLTRLLDGQPGNAGNGFGRQGAAPRVAAVNAGYQFNLDTFSDSVAWVTGPLASQLLALGLPLRTMEHESGPGQLEFTFSPMAALDAADAMLLFRTLVKQGCARQGCHASFMTLPRIDGFDASGWHLHQSVVNLPSGENLFAAGGGGNGISADGKAYLEGLLARTWDFCLLCVPTVNGYRRFAPEVTLAPSRIGSSYEDRSVMVRVLGAGASTHFENRMGEPCANPYLLIAAQLAAGLAGIAADLGPERAAGGPDGASSEQLPRSLREALDAFRTSDHARDLLGDPLAACLAKVKASEVARFEDWCATAGLRPEDVAGQVTEWEHREYFGAY
jgi:glutamine synthetase